MTRLNEAISVLSDWWDSLPTYRQKNGLPAQGTLASALVVLEHLQSNYSLNLSAHMAPGGAQIAGLSGTQVQRILARFGEARPFLREGGRTNRGNPAPVRLLLASLDNLQLHTLSTAERNGILMEMQRWLVSERVSEYFKRERVKLIFDEQQTAWQLVHELLNSARTVGKEGQVAQYLIGAKLTHRFPNTPIRNDSYSTADLQSGSQGDFVVGDTVFHVTVAPTPGHYEKCRSNLAAGRKATFLVPDRLVVGTKQNTENVAPGRISVTSIETFVSQNLEELATFSNDAVRREFRQLFDIYNKRVDAIETDKSLLIEIPPNL